MKNLNMMTLISQRLLLLVIVASLSACVTEQIGGFKTNDEKALHDYLQLSMKALEIGDLANARRYLGTVNTLDEDNAEMHGIWGLVHAQEGDLTEADESFVLSLKKDPDHTLTRNNYAAFLYSNGRFVEAYEQLEIVVKDTEYISRAQAFENLGLVGLRLERTDDAQQAFSRAVVLNSTQLRSITELIDIHMARNEMSQAQGYYNDLMNLQQRYQVAQTSRHLFQGVKLAQAQGYTEQAIQLAELLSSNFPNSPENQVYQQSIE